MQDCRIAGLQIGGTMRKIHGYVRVSSRDQNEDRQMIALKEFSISEENIMWTNSLVRILIIRSIGNYSEK